MTDPAPNAAPPAPVAPPGVVQAAAPNTQPMTPPQKSRLKDYLLVCLSIVLIDGVCIVGVMIARPGVDNTPMMVAIIGFAGVALPILISLIKSEDNAAASRAAIQEVHFSLNSRLTEWMESERRHAQAASVAARAEGRTEGIGVASLSPDTIMAIQVAVEHLLRSRNESQGERKP